MSKDKIEDMMFAAVCEKYGSAQNVKIHRVKRPTPGVRDVLIRVKAATLSSADHRIRAQNMPLGFGFLSRLILGFYRPKRSILGSDIAGEIVAVGDQVVRFKIGDQVTGSTGTKMGCHAEYVLISDSANLIHKPKFFTHAESVSLIFGGSTSLYFLEKANIKENDRILINGASGAVGLAMTQLASSAGAKVTGVCSSKNSKLVLSFGANDVIDYEQMDITKYAEKWDIIVDLVGNLSYQRCRKLLTKKGQLLLLCASIFDLLLIPWIGLNSKHRILAGPSPDTFELLQKVFKEARNMKLIPIIDRAYPLNQIVDAHQYVDSRRKCGAVIIEP